jgi:hypothetical protein
MTFGIHCPVRQGKELILQANVEWRFERGDVGAAEIQTVVDDIIVELATPGSGAAQAARAAGVDPADLAGGAVRVREGRQGAEPLLTTIVVGIAVKIGSAAVEALWRTVIWPSLRRRLGAGVLGARLAGNDRPTADGSPAATGRGEPGAG